MFVAVARVVLDIQGAKSLKDKRQVLRRVVDRVKARFNVSVAEVGEADEWRRAEVGLTVVSNEHRHAVEQIDKVVHFIDEMYVAPVSSRRTEVFTMGDIDHTDTGTLDASMIDRGERTLAEAEGLPPLDELFADKGRPTSPISIDEKRKRARALRNPRMWEKK